jgi:alkanesulfonate monooxygenase SsuD/methylene tetrahydromethanopterin reductase-like flavin-dependent oxidoreductase (luciferase family)
VRAQAGAAAAPPILIGATGDRALRVVAEHADIWNIPTPGDVADFRRRSAVLDGHCAAIGRDPAEIVRSAQLLLSAHEPSGRGTPGPFPIVGPSQARQLLVELIDAGASHLVLAPVGSLAVRRLADEVVAPVLAEVERARQV